MSPSKILVVKNGECIKVRDKNEEFLNKIFEPMNEKEFKDYVSKCLEREVDKAKTHAHPFSHIPYDNIIFNDPATIVFWSDGTKTVVKTMDGDKYDPEVGFAMAFCKKIMETGYRPVFKKVREDYLKSIETKENK